MCALRELSNFYMFLCTTFAGMLLGLLVKYLWFDGEENGESMGNVCACRGTIRTSQVIMVNSTSVQHVGKISQRCPMASTFQMVTCAM